MDDIKSTFLYYACSGDNMSGFAARTELQKLQLHEQAHKIRTVIGYNRIYKTMREKIVQIRCTAKGLE